MVKNFVKDINYIKPSLSFTDLVSNFNLLDDFEERYGYIIELGQKLPHFPDHLKVDSHKVNGCISQVWMLKGFQEGGEDRFAFAADSDSSIVRGLIFVLATIYSGRKIKELNEIDEINFLEQLGFQDKLSINRRNGFAAMIQNIKKN